MKSVTNRALVAKKKMYIQPKSEMTELNPSRALLEGSVTVTTDPHTGTGGDAPKRRTEVF